jgi:hypothetical protein
MNLLLHKLYDIQDKKVYYKLKYDKEGIVYKKQEGGMMAKKVDGLEYMHHYASKEWEVMRKMHSDKYKKLKSNFGLAFVTCASMPLLKTLTEDFNEVKKDILDHNPILY